MCWNADISLNTFVFAILALVFIYAANTYTKYKSSMFDNKLVYLFMLDVAAVQLVEYFLWKNLKNPSMNAFLSKINAFVIAMQPLILVLMIPKQALRRGMVLAYAVCALLFFVLKKAPIWFHTSVAPNGHLSWDWINYKGYWLPLFVLFFYGVSMLSINNFKLSLFILALVAVSFINYYKYNKYQTVGSMWCWSGNLFSLFLLLDLLLIKPYYDYNVLC